jgi:hypothetical protein
MVAQQLSLDSLVEQSPEPIKVREGWCHANQMFYCDGWGYGIADSGATVCLGKAANIEVYFRTGIAGDISKMANEILNEIKKLEDINAREYAIEQRNLNAKLRTPTFKRRNYQRIRPVTSIGGKSKNFKPVKVRTKPSLYPVRPE